MKTKTRIAIEKLLQDVKDQKKYVKNGELYNSSTDQKLGYINKNGYKFYGVAINRISLPVKAHHFMYVYYFDVYPENMVIDHKDGNRENNRPENLELVTHQENSRRGQKNKSGISDSSIAFQLVEERLQNGVYIHDGIFLYRNYKDKKRKLGYKDGKYLMLSISFQQKCYRIALHQLNYMLFKGSIPEGYVINHVDGHTLDERGLLNNHIDNLELLTLHDNTLHAHISGLVPSARKNKDRDDKIGQLRYSYGYSVKRIQELYDLDSRQLSFIFQRYRDEEGIDLEKDRLERNQNVLALMEEGLSLKNIVEVTGLKLSTIKHIRSKDRKEKNISIRSEYQKRNQAIISKFLEGKSYIEIGKEFGISPSASQHMVSRHYYQKQELTYHEEKQRRDINILNLYSKCYTYQGIADMLNLSLGTVTGVLSRKGKEIKEEKQLQKEERDNLVVQLYATGITVKQVCKELELEYDLVVEIIQQKGQKAKLLRKELLQKRQMQVIDLFNKNMSYKEIAENTKESYNYVKGLINRLRQKDML